MTSLQSTACDVLIRNAVVLTATPLDTVIDRGAIAIHRGRIAAVGPETAVLPLFRADRVINAQGGVVHPGFIDAHVHISQYTSRSVLSRMAGTHLTMGNWKCALTAEDEHASALLASLDYLKSGYTGFVDPGTIFEPDAVAAAVEEIGIRAWLTDPYVADLGGTLQQELPELASASFLARWPRNHEKALARLGSQLFRNRTPDSRVRAFIGLYGEGTDSDALFRAAADVAQKNGVRMQKHLGYSPATHRAREAALGCSMMNHLREQGLLSAHMTFIHMNVVHASDVDLLSSQGVRVVWCPYGQLQMIGRGGAEGRMGELWRAGVGIGIGSDIARAVHVGALGSLALGASAATGLALSGSEILQIRTLGSAATVGAEGVVGSIEAGKYADLVIRKPQASEHLMLDPALELGVIAGADSIAAVMVNGRVVVENGKLLTADEAAVIARAHQSAQALLRRIGEN